MDVVQRMNPASPLVSWLNQIVCTAYVNSGLPIIIMHEAGLVMTPVNVLTLLSSQFVAAPRP